MDGSDLFNAFCRKHGHRFEGDSGLERLELLIECLGYRAHGFRFGNLIETFLSDNSGAVEKIIDFIVDELDNESSEWRESMLAEFGEESEEDDDDLQGAIGATPDDASGVA